MWPLAALTGDRITCNEGYFYKKMHGRFARPKKVAVLTNVANLNQSRSVFFISA